MLPNYEDFPQPTCLKILAGLQVKRAVLLLVNNAQFTVGLPDINYWVTTTDNFVGVVYKMQRTKENGSLWDTGVRYIVRGGLTKELPVDFVREFVLQPTSDRRGHISVKLYDLVKQFNVYRANPSPHLGKYHMKDQRQALESISWNFSLPCS